MKRVAFEISTPMVGLDRDLSSTYSADTLFGAQQMECFGASKPYLQNIFAEGKGIRFAIIDGGVAITAQVADITLDGKIMPIDQPVTIKSSPDLHDLWIGKLLFFQLEVLEFDCSAVSPQHDAIATTA